MTSSPLNLGPSNFLGLDALRVFGSEVLIRLSAGEEEWSLSSVANKLVCDPEVVPRLSIDLVVPSSGEQVEAAIRAADLMPDDVRLVLFGEDRFLKERETLHDEPVLECLGECAIVSDGAIRAPAISNSREGFHLELALVLASDKEPAKGRPHRSGTKLFTSTFRVKPFADPEGLNPVELTSEVIQENHLSRKTQVFVEFKDELLGDASVSDALTVHIDKKLLKGIKARRTGLEYNYLTTSMAINALQQVVFELSREMAQQASEDYSGDPSPVLALAASRLREVTRLGASKLTTEEAIVLIAEEPQVAAALLTGLHDMTPDSRKLIRDSEDAE